MGRTLTPSAVIVDSAGEDKQPLQHKQHHNLSQIVQCWPMSRASTSATSIWRTSCRARIIVALAAAVLAWASISTDAEAFAPGSITAGGQDISIAANGWRGHGDGDEGFAYRAQAASTPVLAPAVTPLNVSDGASTSPRYGPQPRHLLCNRQHHP